VPTYSSILQQLDGTGQNPYRDGAVPEESWSGEEGGQVAKKVDSIVNLIIENEFSRLTKYRVQI
jgi:hypothetical protein